MTDYIAVILSTIIWKQYQNSITKEKGTSRKVVWTSSNRNVVTVKNGKITGKKQGKGIAGEQIKEYGFAFEGKNVLIVN